MTVKVVNDPKSLKFVYCQECGCQLEYVHADVDRGYRYPYEGGRDVYHFIKCPNCRGMVYV